MLSFGKSPFALHGQWEASLNPIGPRLAGMGGIHQSRPLPVPVGVFVASCWPLPELQSLCTRCASKLCVIYCAWHEAVYMSEGLKLGGSSAATLSLRASRTAFETIVELQRFWGRHLAQPTANVQQLPRNKIGKGNGKQSRIT